MFIALRDAPRGGQDGARLNFYGECGKNPTESRTPADLQACACGYEHLRVTEQPKNCGEVTP